MKSRPLNLVLILISTYLLILTIQASAATLTWQIVDGSFTDGATVTGIFDYDATSGTVSNWNLWVTGGTVFPDFTYNMTSSSALTHTNGTIQFQGPYLGPYSNSYRHLRFNPSSPLTGAISPVALDQGGLGSVECNNCAPSRLLSGSLVNITDADGDGHTSSVDCDDNDASTFPGADELCDGYDNNCDDIVPEDEYDTDADGYMICENDCDDANPAINPDAYELPGNATDENCDGSLGACDPFAIWKNHGQYVRCVAHETDALIELGVLTEEEGDILINTAAQSDVGKK